MNFLHYELNLGVNEIVEITLDVQANVRLLDELNFLNYRNGRHYTYYGGLARVRPVHLAAPYPGRWHLVIDLGGYPGTVQASVRIVLRQG